MNLLSSLVDAPALDALACALVHFVWQGAVLALLLAVWFRWGRAASHARYVAGVVTLAAMLVAPVATFAWIASAPACPIDRGGARCADDAARTCGRCHRHHATRGRA